jgi:hypothetical protein
VSLLTDILQTHAVRDARYVLDTRLVVRNTTAPVSQRAAPKQAATRATS